MISRVKIKIESIIDNLDESGFADGESERNFTEVDGIYHYGNDGARISYKEESEGGKSESEILVFSDAVKVSRHGAIESDLLFSVGVAHTSVYGAPPYTFDMRIYTRKIRGSIGESGGVLDIFYDMEIGGAKKSVKMTVACEID